MKTGITLSIVIFLFLSIGLNTMTIADRQDLNIQDGRFLKKLEWYSPNGELPGTYEEYLQIHPLKSAYFSDL